mmetsp:Transcript_15083/g.49643  ORF Transcript_15083/g.49643 Transcript_15083/m.49643 type:complete len:91 (+) Transcript_15083:107-379(+)
MRVVAPVLFRSGRVSHTPSSSSRNGNVTTGGGRFAGASMVKRGAWNSPERGRHALFRCQIRKKTIAGTGGSHLVATGGASREACSQLRTT